jgi:hypothetical protein
MQVNRPSNIPGFGPGSADRANKDGQRKGGHGGGKEEPQKQPAHDEDQVQLHEPEGEKPGAKQTLPVRSPKPAPGKQPPLDLSA